MPVLILSFSLDDHLPLVVPHLNDKEFILYSDKPFLFHFDPAAATGQIEQDGRRLAFSEITSIWNRRPFTIPGKELPHQRFTRLEIRACVMQSLMNQIPFDLWINHPDAVDGSRDKVRVLKCAHECDLNCPAWIVSNQADAIFQFAAKYNGWVVIKALVSVSEALDVLPSLLYARPVSQSELREKIAGKMIFPLFVQSRIRKAADWRITIIDDVISATRMTGCPAETLDFRRAYDKLCYENRVLDKSTIESLRRLVTLLKLRYAAIDMVEEEGSGDLFFLEVNPSGQFGWMEEAAGLGGQAHFSEHLAQALLSNCSI